MGYILAHNYKYMYIYLVPRFILTYYPEPYFGKSVDCDFLQNWFSV